MTEAAAIAATFSDWRTVKSRKCLQLIFEVPLEKQAEILTMLGAPLPDNPRWCGIAVLKAPVAEPKQPDPDRSEIARRTYRNLPPMKQAAARAAQLCTDQKFQQWVGAKHTIVPSVGDPAAFVSNWMRRHLGVESRSEIGLDEETYRRFLALETAYKQDTGQMAEQRG